MSQYPPQMSPIPDPNDIRPESAKDPVLIIVLAVILGAVAYFVLGQWQKGIAGVAAWFALLVFGIITCGIGLILFFPFHVAVIVDVYMQANLLKEGRTIGQWTFFTAHK